MRFCTIMSKIEAKARNGGPRNVSTELDSAAYFLVSRSPLVQEPRVVSTSHPSAELDLVRTNLIEVTLRTPVCNHGSQF